MGELVLLVARRRLKLDDIIISACISKVDGEYFACVLIRYEEWYELKRY
jgi:hypothetical protein